MAQGVVADNWSLQDISTLFTDGLEKEDAGEIIIEGGEHFYKPVSSAVIQTEALFDFLVDLILRDEILVEERYANSWEDFDSPILKAKELGVVRPYPFLSEPHKIAGPREKIVQHICSTESLKEAHQLNVEGWRTNKQTPDGLLSATLWGGAGMCARSFVYEKSYTPHPLRRRLFVNSGFMLPAGDSTHQLTSFLADKKVSVFKKVFGNDSLYSAYVNIPAIPLRVIQESNTAQDMIYIALQMRDDFQPLREWLKSFQNAISSGDAQEMMRYRKQLDSVSNYVDSKIGLGVKKNPVTMQTGIGVFKISLAGNPIESLKNQFGIRAMINRLIFAAEGKPAIKKYIKMFDESGSAVGYEVEAAFS